ncbi:MAG: hypothetical protein ACT4NV_03195 [Rhodoferax sp.]
MNGYTVTICPTITNPEAIHSIPELRREFHRANENIIVLADQLDRVSDFAHQLRMQLTKLVQAHIAGDQPAIQAELTELAERYQREQQAKPWRQH